MSSSLDKALLAMTIEEDDEPFTLPDLPEYCSCQSNSLSLIGRILNPDCQKVSNLIRDMPRKWQKYDRVRGIALSSERFQFIFKYEHDLEEILDKGVHTFNDWALAIERWIEKPPPDYLKFIPIWVRLRNLPVNYYTFASINALGDLAGQVVEVAFDPTKPQSNDYVRVKIRFDVSRPLRRSKVVNLPNGDQTTILYEYERIHKRCFFCQRLTHEQTLCPLKLKAKKQVEKQSKLKTPDNFTTQEPFLKDSDPLFGVLQESQVGINPNTGRQRIAKEVLDEMRQYILAASDSEKLIREHRVKASVADIGNDILAQKSQLSLEAIPHVTHQVDKGKGPVFEFNTQEKISATSNAATGYHTKLLASAIQAAKSAPPPVHEVFYSEGSANNYYDKSMAFIEFSSVNTAIHGEAGISGTASASKFGKTRRRPPKLKRQIQGSASATVHTNIITKQSNSQRGSNKRKNLDDEEQENYNSRKVQKAVSNEGLPKGL